MEALATSSWQHSTLGNTCVFENGDRGKNYPSPGSFVPMGRPFVNAGHLRSRSVSFNNMDYITEEAFERLGNGKFKVGDILFCLRGSLGKFAIVGPSVLEGAIASSLVIIRPKPQFLSSEFLGIFLNSDLCSAEIKKWAGGAAQPNLGAGDLSRFELPLPSLEEQKKITDAISSTEALITSLERLIGKKQAIKQGMMQQLLTGKTRLPGFKEDWTEFVLGDHVVYINVVALSRAELDSSSALRYLHYGDIHTSKDVRIDAAEIDMPRVAASKVRNAGRLQVGDLVFADASEDSLGVGKSVEVVSVPLEGLVPGLHTIAARFDKSFLADGFKAYLQFIPEFRESLLRLAAGTKVLSTTRRYISSVVLKLPKLAEQQAIAKVLRDVDSEIDLLQLQLKNTREMKQGMMQELLTGRTRLTPTGE